VLNSVIKNVGGSGIRATNAVTPPVQVGISETAAILDNKGVEANAHSRVTIVRSVLENAATDGATADAADAQMMVSDSDSSFNQNGITATAGGLTNSAFNNITFNSACGMNNSGGTNFFTYGNNRQAGTGSCGTINPAPQQ
jgi:hypothetical protein